MLEIVLLVGKIVFLIVLYLFIFRVIRSSTRELRMAAPGAGRQQWSMPGAAVQSLQTSGGQSAATLQKAGEVWTLLVVKSQSLPAGAAYALPPETHALAGRLPDMDIFLDDTFVSAKHALFEVTSDGLWVEDLRSTNGTQVNGTVIEEPTLLEVGDRVTVGDTVFQVEAR